MHQARASHTATSSLSQTHRLTSWASSWNRFSTRCIRKTLVYHMAEEYKINFYQKPAPPANPRVKSYNEIQRLLAQAPAPPTHELGLAILSLRSLGGHFGHPSTSCPRGTRLNFFGFCRFSPPSWTVPAVAW